MGVDTRIIEAIKSRIGIVDLVGRYVQLRPMSGRFVAPCPFHQETKPSFSVNPEKGIFYCFGCQAGGDIFDFYGQINGLEFKDTLEALAREAGVELGGRQHDPAEEERRRQRKACGAMHELAQDYFRRTLASPAGTEARQYLEKRDVSAEMVERFGLGCSTADWHGLEKELARAGFSPEEGVIAGLLSSKEGGRFWDRFRGRLIFPIQDLAGKVIAFGGRIMGDAAEGAPKYLNSSETPLYTKGEHLFGLFQARPSVTRTRRLLLTEGYLDVIALHEHGWQDSVGVLGTALTTDQVRRMAGLAKSVDLVFDGDRAGRKAAFRSAEMLLKEGLTCRVVLLPDGEDVDSLLRAKGKEGFAACLESAQEGLDFCMAEMRGTGSPREILDWARGFVSGLRDAAWRAFFLPRLAPGLGLDADEFARTLAATPGRDSRNRVSATRTTGGAGGISDRTEQAPRARRDGACDDASPPAWACESAGVETYDAAGLDDDWDAQGHDPEYSRGRSEAPQAMRGRSLKQGWRDRRAGGAGPRGAIGRVADIGEKRDRELLCFAVRFPHYVPELERRGGEELFRGDWARSFWRLLRERGPEALGGLDARASELVAEALALPLGNESSEWVNICSFVDKTRVMAQRERILEALRRAKDTGDSAEIQRLTSEMAKLTCAFNEILGRSDE